MIINMSKCPIYIVYLSAVILQFKKKTILASENLIFIFRFVVICTETLYGIPLIVAQLLVVIAKNFDD